MIIITETKQSLQFFSK